MVGQNHVLAALKNALDSDRLHHAYLFTGTRGVGKTTLARILAKCLNCERGVSSESCGQCSACVSIDEGRFVDLIEVDAASRAKVEETRDLMDNVQYAPSSGRYKVYLIDEVHMFSNHSFNALLKTLEEPPPHVKFLLATTEPKKLPVTILSRCLQFNLKQITRDQIAKQLQSIVKEESVEADDTSLRLIASGANGSMRDALSLLDQAISFCGGDLKEAEVREMLGTIDSSNLSRIYDALLREDAGELMNCIKLMDEHSPDYDAVLAEILSDLHDMALCQIVGASNIDSIKPELTDLAEQFDKEDLQLFYQIALKGRRDLYSAPEPKLGFEMTMIRMLAFKPAGSLGNVPAVQSGGATKRSKFEHLSSENAGSIETIDIETSKDWKKLIDEMALTGLLKELAGHCVLKDFNKERVQLVLKPAQEHLLNTAQKEKLERAIKARFGNQVKLVVNIEETEAETPKQEQHRLEQDRQGKAVESFNDDPTVKEMVDTFDAKVDQNSIQPH
jgi:DNA polymerase-3 subunit gamma/tau